MDENEAPNGITTDDIASKLVEKKLANGIIPNGDLANGHHHEAAAAVMANGHA